jgi:hypothetical protein
MVQTLRVFIAIQGWITARTVDGTGLAARHKTLRVYLASKFFPLKKSEIARSRGRFLSFFALCWYLAQTCGSAFAAVA